MNDALQSLLATHAAPAPSYGSGGTTPNYS